jgi:hemolysin III
MTGVVPADEERRPRLRGVSHQYAFFGSLVTGLALVYAAPTEKAVVATAIYGLSVSALFGASAAYHRGRWSASARRWMRRLDHSMIFFLIAGTYTPFCVLVIPGTFASVVLAVVWGGALFGIGLNLFWTTAPRWMRPVVYVALGWVAVFTLPALVLHVGWAGTLLLALGGLLYSLGAIVYALRRPDPVPAVFGFHEVFHALVITAALVQYAVIAFYVLPRS